jgi:S1-C subfamily serine protease
MDMTEQLARSYRLPLETGVVITALQKGLDPEFLGPGDIVTKIDGHRVTGVESFLRAARNADLRKGVLIQYVSDHPLRQDWERIEIVSSID